MAEAENLRRMINPCLLHLQKMGLELKCPICLNLLRRPILLPCNHMLCRPCVPEIGSSCLVCNVPFLHQDLRSVPQMENIVSIYSSMEAAGPSGGTDISEKLRVEQMQNSQLVTLNPEASSVPSVQADKRVKTSHPIKSESETPERPAKYFKLGDGMKSHECVSQNCVHSAKVGAFVNEVNPAWSPSSTSMDMNCKMGEAHQRDVNQWAQTSPGSPPSFSNMKDSDDNHNDQGSEHANLFQTTLLITGNALSKYVHIGSEHASGPMLHYANGRALVVDQATQANALHVLRKCTEWAPQVYFDGETVINLEAKLARGSKIKCSSCGKKGAALSCLVKSCRRSFHVPCAVNIFDCQWDCKLSTNIGRFSFNVKQSNKLWEASSGVTSKWVLCGSVLSSMEKDLLAEFVSLTGASVTESWEPNVTHVIASTNDMCACSRTLKFLMGILNSSRWIVKVDWIKACMEAKHPVDEVMFMAVVMAQEMADLKSPREGSKVIQWPQLYFSGNFVLSYKGFLRDLVAAAGGNVLAKKDIEYLESKMDTEATHSATLLIYNADSPQECKEADRRLGC